MKISENLWFFETPLLAGIWQMRLGHFPKPEISKISWSAHSEWDHIKINGLSRRAESKDAERHLIFVWAGCWYSAELDLQNGNPQAVYPPLVGLSVPKSSTSKKVCAISAKNSLEVQSRCVLEGSSTCCCRHPECVGFCTPWCSPEETARQRIRQHFWKSGNLEIWKFGI